MAILLVKQYFDFAYALAQEIVVLDRGPDLPFRLVAIPLATS